MGDEEETKPAAEDSSHVVPKEYELILMAVLADGEVDPLERQMLAEFAAEHPACIEHHEALLSRSGWTLEEYNVGLKIGDPRRNAQAAKQDKEDSKWIVSASNLTSDAAHLDLEQALATANERFLSAYFEELEQAIDGTCKEVIAAKVPLASYGRVRDALNRLKSNLNGRAKQLLTDELSELGKIAIITANAKDGEVATAQEEAKKSSAQIESLKQQAAAAAATAEAAAAELREVSTRSSAPLAHIKKAEDAAAELERQLVVSNAKIAKLREDASEAEEEWETHLIECLRKCTLQIKAPDTEPSTDPRKAEFGTAANSIDKALSKLEKGHGVRLAYIIKKYEGAKDSATKQRNEMKQQYEKTIAQNDEVAKNAMAAKNSESQKKEVLWQKREDELVKALKEAEGATEKRVEDVKVQAMEDSAAAAAKHSQTAGALENEISSMKDTVTTAKRERAEMKAELEQMRAARRAADASLAKEEEGHSLDKARLSECLERLYAAQSACRHGGYYFSAAAHARSPPRKRLSQSPERDDQHLIGNRWSPSDVRSSPLMWSRQHVEGVHSSSENVSPAAEDRPTPSTSPNFRSPGSSTASFVSSSKKADEKKPIRSKSGRPIQGLPKSSRKGGGSTPTPPSSSERKPTGAPASAKRSPTNFETVVE